MMSEFGCKVEGLEVSQETTQRARDAILKLKLDDVITVDSYDGGGIIPKPDNHYDLVVGLQCVYYNLDQSQFASECNRILSSDGLIFFSFFSPRHGYMENIDGLPGGPVRFNEKQPNQRLIGLHPFLYKDRPQFSDIYGEWFDVSVGIEEFDTLPVFQSWYYLRGQKKIASNKTRIDFPLSYPVDEINGVILDKKEYEVAENNVHIKYGDTVNSYYPNEHLVRFLATRRKRESGEYFKNSVGNEESEAILEDVQSLIIEPLNAVHIEPMIFFGYEPHVLSSNRSLIPSDLLKKDKVQYWDRKDIPFLDDTFDCVISYDSIYKIPDQKNLASEVNRVTSKTAEICLFYIARDHGIMKFVELIAEKMYRVISDCVPSLPKGTVLFVPTEKDIYDIWSDCFDIKVSHINSDTSNIFSSYCVVYGKKINNQMRGRHE